MRLAADHRAFLATITVLWCLLATVRAQESWPAGTSLVGPPRPAPVAPGLATAQDDDDDDDPPALEIYWDQGLHFDTLQRRFTLTLGGSAQNDSAAIGRSGFGSDLSGVQWRRVRLFADGIFARHFDYRFQYDFAQNNPPNLKDAFVGFDAPVFPLRVYGGRFRAPLGLEGHTSGNDTTFMERGLTSTFLPSRNTGFMFISDAQRQRYTLRLQIGLIQPEDDFDIGNTDKLGVSMRGAYAFTPRPGVVVHAGGDWAHRTVNESIRFVQRPESNIAPFFTDTGEIPATSIDTGIFEFAIVEGPWSFQTEYAITKVNGTASAKNPVFWGGYGFVSYMITGETRPYQADRGNFGRLVPTNAFDGTGGYGALEVAFRVSYLDLDDQNVTGGRLLDLTTAFNWHVSRNIRVLNDVIWARPTLVDENTWIAQIRLQWAL